MPVIRPEDSRGWGVVQMLVGIFALSALIVWLVGGW